MIKELRGGLCLPGALVTEGPRPNGAAIPNDQAFLDAFDEHARTSTSTDHGPAAVVRWQRLVLDAFQEASTSETHRSTRGGATPGTARKYLLTEK